jgi:phosphatidylserine/phosphatidylglycerophosphate/cardiolipin synthase-like enzyme
MNKSVVIFMLALSYGSIANARESFTDYITGSWAASTITAPTSAKIEVGFSPEGSAEFLVVKAINAAQKSIRVMAYSFTSRPIAEALVQAHKRGVDVQVVVDKSQYTEKYTSASFLANAGINVRVDSQHVIQHSKFIEIDDRHLETGSFNYTSAASKKNSENVIMIWNNADLARVYLANWNQHNSHSEEYR